MHEIFPITPRSPASRPPLQALLSRIHTYESRRDLLTHVENRSNDQTISRYDYTNDPARRRTQMTKSGTMMPQEDTLNYGYNNRNEIITAHAQNDPAYHYDYTFDAIGNRLTSTESGTNSVYLANKLNQYTAINDFEPQFDPDGNQLLIQTATGLWHVTYNGENRPILWTQDNTRIEMIYDRLGRRISYKSTTGDTVTRHNLFLYNGYLCVQELNATPPWEIHREFVWDPTQKTATRPLQFTMPGKKTTLFYMFDGNKNVTDLISQISLAGVAAHYDYAPFGFVDRVTGAEAFSNPYRFSSEYHDDELGLVRYNYRHYDPSLGRWLSRDPIEEAGGVGLYVLSSNTLLTDWLGLAVEPPPAPPPSTPPYAADCVCKGDSNIGTHQNPNMTEESMVKGGIIDNKCSTPGNKYISWPYDSFFLNACKKHDRCYAKCGSDKSQCDDIFYQNMRNECYTLPYYRLVDCLLEAWGYYQAVKAFGNSEIAAGDQSFGELQKKVCEPCCCKK